MSWGTPAANIGVPGTTNYGEKHTLKVVVTHKFDKVANPKTVGTSARYQFALRTSGMFKGTPTGYTAITGATASGDFVKFEGDGIFGSTSATTRLLGPVPAGAPACNTFNSLASPLDVNYCPLKRTMGVTTARTSSFSTNPALQQVVTYPSYVCDNGTNCTPTVILTMTATVNGPDLFILSSSDDAGGGSCSLGDQGPPSSTATVPCHESKKGKKSLDGLISEYFATQARADAAAFAAEGAESTPACAGGECLCQDPDTCAADSTITITKNTTLESSDTFTFSITGPSTSDQSINMGGTNTESIVVPVDAGTYNISENPLPGWSLDSSSCGGEGGPTTGVVVPSGANVSCTFNSSVATTNPPASLYTTNDFVKATLTFDQPLPANLHYQDVTGYPGYQLIMNDGHQTLTEGALYIDTSTIISTDSLGQIIAPWYVVSHSNDPQFLHNNHIVTSNDPGGVGIFDRGQISNDSPDTWYGGVSSLPGTWVGPTGGSPGTGTYNYTGNHFTIFVCGGSICPTGPISLHGALANTVVADQFIIGNRQDIFLAKVNNAPVLDANVYAASSAGRAAGRGTTFFWKYAP